MKILFLSHYFPPEVNAPATRAHEHCKAWVAAGHEVTVVTGAPNHPFGELYPGYKNQRTEHMVDGIRVIRVKTYITANKGILKRTLSYISFMLATIYLCGSFGKHDVLLTTSPQFFNGFAGFFVSRLKRIPWLLEIRDLWPDSILAVGAIKNKLVIDILYKLELFCYKTCDRIVVVTDSFRHYIIGRGITSTKISVIKNGVNLSLFSPEKNIDMDTLKLEMPDIPISELQNKFVVSYVGTHGMAHKLETVLEAANLLKNQPDIRFLFVGDGAEKQDLVKLKEKMGLDNVIMADQKPKKLMPAIWQLTDLSLVHLKKDDLFKTVIPSKIFEALAMGKPIILGVEGESAELLRNSGGGVTVEPENAQQMADAILKLSQNPELCEAMATEGKKYVGENFDRAKLARDFELVIQGMVTQGRSTRAGYLF
jgi:glycosyltransferase involved in cell wall biosynthesis